MRKIEFSCIFCLFVKNNAKFTFETSDDRVTEKKRTN